jgi:flagellar protein FliL
MADKSTEDAPKAEAPKKKGNLVKIIILVVVLATAGGGGYYFWHISVAKAAANAAKGKKEDNSSDDKPSGKSKSKSGSDKADKDKTDRDKTDKLAAMLPEDEDVKQVIELPAFTLNLADPEENRFLRLAMSIGVAEEAAEKPDPIFLTRVRNAALAVLMTKTSADILSADGKTALRKELLDALHEAVKEPHVQAIYITELIVQQ